MLSDNLFLNVYWNSNILAVFLQSHKYTHEQCPFNTRQIHRNLIEID